MTKTIRALGLFAAYPITFHATYFTMFRGCLRGILPSVELRFEGGFLVGASLCLDRIQDIKEFPEIRNAHKRKQTPYQLNAALYVAIPLAVPSFNSVLLCADIQQARQTFFYCSDDASASSAQ